MSMKHAILVILSTITVVTGLPAQNRVLDGICNGHAELCNRSYGNVTYAGAHDSFAWSSDPLALARTQTVNVMSQLKSGVRMLEAQSHMYNGQIHFCHTSCLLFNGGTALSFLQTVKSFLDANPSEVVTLLLTNPEGLSANNVWLPVFQSSGIVPYAYSPPHQPMSYNEWPTLGQLIAANTRLVIFFDYPSLAGDTLPFVSYEFHNIWETPFDSTDANFPCSVNRGQTPPDITSHMSLINHYLNYAIGNITIPDHLAVSTTNSVKSIVSNANDCTKFTSGRAPNFVLLDWVVEGQVTAAINQLNGLPNPTQKNFLLVMMGFVFRMVELFGEAAS